MAEQGLTAGMVERAKATGEEPVERQAEALFGPGVAQPGVRGLAGREGMPRQWAYGASVNVAQRPRGTEQTSFEQLRNLQAADQRQRTRATSAAASVSAVPLWHARRAIHAG